MKQNLLHIDYIQFLLKSQDNPTEILKLLLEKSLIPKLSHRHRTIGTARRNSVDRIFFSPKSDKGSADISGNVGIILSCFQSKNKLQALVINYRSSVVVVTDEYSLDVILLWKLGNINVGSEGVACVKLKAEVAVLRRNVNTDDVIISLGGEVPLFDLRLMENGMRNM